MPERESLGDFGLGKRAKEESPGAARRGAEGPELEDYLMGGSPSCSHFSFLTDNNVFVSS